MTSLCELRIEGSEGLAGHLPPHWSVLQVTDYLSLSKNALSGMFVPSHQPCTFLHVPTPPALALDDSKISSMQKVVALPDMCQYECQKDGAQCSR